MLNTPGKEMDLLRVTVKVPGKRPPRAVPACGAPAGLNGRVKDVTGPEGFSTGEKNDCTIQRESMWEILILDAYQRSTIGSTFP